MTARLEMGPRRRGFLRSRRRWGMQVLLLSAAVLGWVLTLAAMQSSLDFRRLLQAEERWFAEDLFFVSRDVRVTDTLKLTRNRVTEADQTALRSVEGVRLVKPVVRNDFAVSIEVGGKIIPGMTSEIFFEALPHEVLAKPPEGWDWKPGDTAVPLLIPRDFLNLYNFGFAPGEGLPPLSESLAKKLSFQLFLYPNGGKFPTPVPGRVAGFSDQIQSILVPEAFLNRANERFAGGKDVVPRRFVVAGMGVRAGELNQVLEAQGLRASGNTATTARLRLLLDSILGVIAVSGLIMLMLNMAVQEADAEAVLLQNADRIQRLFLLGHAPGVLVRGLVGRQLVVLCGTMGAALLLVAACREAVVDGLRQAGLGVDPGLDVRIWGGTCALLIVLMAWYCIRVGLRVRRLYLCER